MDAELIQSVRDDLQVMQEIRRDIHRHPELGYEERRTSELIARSLSDWGIRVHRGLAKTGVVGIIENGRSGRSIGLRADMDALPIIEKNTFAHASVHAGKMHACGHDGHVAMLLAAAKYLSAHRTFEGTIYFIFQPAEEGGGGAREMIKEGLFQIFPMEAIFGVHNFPGMDVGKFSIKDGPITASGSKFRITIRGLGTHAAMPHKGIDPVPVACQMVQAFQTIVSRNKSPTDAAVLSVTMIHAGEATNVVPDWCEIRGTVRTFTLEVLDMVERRMRKIAEATCAAFDADCEFEFERYYPPTINSPKETAFVREALRHWAGTENVLELEPTMGSEDFSFYLLEKPGCFFMIGNGDGSHRIEGHGPGPCLVHNSNYDFNDELIPLGATMWVRLVEAWFSRAT